MSSVITIFVGFQAFCQIIASYYAFRVVVDRWNYAGRTISLMVFIALLTMTVRRIQVLFVILLFDPGSRFSNATAIDTVIYQTITSILFLLAAINAHYLLKNE